MKTAFALLAVLAILVYDSGLWRPAERRLLMARLGSRYDLTTAIQLGDPAQVERLLKHGANPNGDGAHSFPPLFLACMSPDPRIPRLLLDHGANVNAYSTSGTALHAASSQGRVEVMRLLIQRGAMLETRDMKGDTPLLAASLSGQPSRSEAIRLLVESGADVNAQNTMGQRPLDYARMLGGDGAAYLVARGAVHGDIPLGAMPQGARPYMRR